MSIQTKVEPYCEKCEKFEPESTTSYSANGPEFTIVTCKHAKECEAKCAYLRKFIPANAECECKKEQVPPYVRKRLLDLDTIECVLKSILEDVRPSALGCSTRYDIEKLGDEIKKRNREIDDEKKKNRKLKCAVAVLGGLIAGNVLAWIIGLIF